MRLFKLSVILLLSISCQAGFYGEARQATNYSEIRSLLLKMRRADSDQSLKTLFEKGEERMAELSQAVCDSDAKVSVNAQVVIQYLADANGLKAIEECRQQRQIFTSPQGMKVFPTMTNESRFLEGSETDLAKLAARNAYFAQQTRRELIVGKVIAYNKTKDKALLEVIYNCVPLCGEGWHVSVKNENGRWRFLSVASIWQS